MSGQEQRPGRSGPSAGEGERPAEPAWRQRQRLDRIFGDVLPESTRDDSPEPSRSEESAADTWLREQVPPHHGD